MSQTPIIDYTTPKQRGRVTWAATDRGVVIYQGRPPVWRRVLAPVAVVGCLPAGLGIAIVSAVHGPPAAGLAALVFLAVGIANAIVVIDDLVQCAKPGTVSIEDGILRVDLPRWFGRVRRERPVSDVKDVLVAKGSASVHAWGDILIRFHNARSVGMLDCASVDEARQVAEVIRVACGLGGPYVMPPGVGGPPAAMPWPPGGAPLPMPPLPAEALAGRDGA